MLRHPQVCLMGMVVEAVGNIRHFALRGGDNACEERPKLSGVDKGLPEEGGDSHDVVCCDSKLISMREISGDLWTIDRRGVGLL